MSPPSEPAALIDDAEQYAAIHAPTMPLRINAGAGSGKTTVMAHRVRVLVERGYRPDQILGLTFSNKAAENLRRRIASEVGNGLDVTVATYHGFGASIVTNYALELGFTTTPRLIDRANSFGLLYGALNEITLDTRKVGRVANLVAAAIRLASQCADHLVSLDEVIADCDRIDADRTIAPEAVKGASGRRDLARLAQVFAVAKKTHNAIDFGDQISLAVQALANEPQRAAAIRDRHPIVLLDEYQDTNYAQRRLLQLIYPPGSPVTVVGDDMQSIYAFRGAHLRNLLDFPVHFAHPSADGASGHIEVVLPTNYRSGPHVVAVANAIAGHVENTLPKVLRTRLDAPLDRIEAVVGEDDVDEANRIADWVGTRGAPWSETVVLGRKRKIFPAIAEALMAKGIPVEIVGIGGLLIRPEVVDVIAWLELLTLDNPNIAVLRLLRSPLRNIGMNDLAVLSQHASRLARADEPDAAHPALSLVRAIDDVDSVAHLSPQAWTRLKAFQADYRYIRLRSAESGLVDLIDAIIDIERLFDRVDDVGAENLLRFLDVADQYSPLDGSPTLASFVQYLSLVADSEDDPSEASATDANAVRIMSIHQAKGLEFDNVVLAGLSGSKSSRIFPDDRSAENGVTQTEVLPLWLRSDNDGFPDPPRTKAQVAAFKDRAIRMRADEERRLLYVAVTRAKRSLLCTAAQWYPGAAEPQGVSTFYTLLCSLTENVVEQLPRVTASSENPEIARRRRRVAGALADDQPFQAENAPEPRPVRGRKGSRPSPDQSSLLAGFGAGHDPRRNDPSTMIPRTSPRMVSTTDLVALARCPQQFEWATVDRLPREPRRAAAFGTDVHTQLEDLLRSRTVGSTPFAASARHSVARSVLHDDGFLDVSLIDDRQFDDDNDNGNDNDQQYDNDNERPADSPVAGTVERLVATVAASQWGDAVVLGVEAPFELELFDPGDRRSKVCIRGRMDAIFRIDDRVHIVDWKTGRPPSERTPADDTQLNIYGLVATRLWGLDPENLSLSYVYIRPDLVDDHTIAWSTSYGETVLDELREMVDTATSSKPVARSGPWCQRCDFRSVCPTARKVRT